MKQKVFISVGMSGRNDAEVIKDICRATEYIVENILDLDLKHDLNVGEYIVDNFDCGPTPPGYNRSLWCLGEAIKKLSECDICYFVKGWQNHKGCIVEHQICELYGIKIIEES